MPPPGATSFLIGLVVFDIIEFRCRGFVAIVGAFAIGAGIFLMLFDGVTLGGTIFEPDAFETEARGFVAMLCFGATLCFGAIPFFVAAFALAARTGFTDFLTGLAACLRTGFAIAAFLCGDAALDFTAALRAGDFFAVVFERITGGVGRLPDFDFFAFAIGVALDLA